MYFKFVSILCMFYVLKYVDSHGRLVYPPGRSSMWRYGFDTPENFNDNELYCGGFQHQQDQDGRCGLCGDPYDGPLENEAGGKYATDAIAKCLAPSETTLDVSVQLTANHLGYFEFKLCENNDFKKRFTQDCLDKHPLKLSGNRSTRYYPGARVGLHNLTLEIPAGLTCDQCVLQWRYHTGNSWGFGEDGKGCIGCGAQEEFYACSDIRISNDCTSSHHKVSTQRPTTNKPTTRLTTTTPRTTSTTVTTKTTTVKPTTKPTTASKTTTKPTTVSSTKQTTPKPTTAPRTTPKPTTAPRTTVNPTSMPTTKQVTTKPTTVPKTTTKPTQMLTTKPATLRPSTSTPKPTTTTVKISTKTSTTMSTPSTSTTTKTTTKPLTSQPTTINVKTTIKQTEKVTTTSFNPPNPTPSSSFKNTSEQSKLNSSEPTTVLTKIISTNTTTFGSGIGKSTTATHWTMKPTETPKPTNSYQGKILRICVATGDYKNDTSVTDWCMENCNAGFCPRTHCKCQDSVGDKLTVLDCRGYGEYSEVPGIDNWCQVNCLSDSGCPRTHCVCNRHYVSV